MTDIDEVLHRVRALTATGRMSAEERTAFFATLETSLKTESGEPQLTAEQAEAMMKIDGLLRGKHVSAEQAKLLRDAVLAEKPAETQAV